MVAPFASRSFSHSVHSSWTKPALFRRPRIIRLTAATSRSKSDRGFDFLTLRVDHFGVALHFFRDRIETSEMHGDERHLLEYGTHAALGDFAVVIRGRDLPVTRIALLTDRIEAAHEFGGVFRIAELLERMGERRDARFFILLAGRSRIALDRINHLPSDRASLEVNSRQAETCDVFRRVVERRSEILWKENAVV